MGKNFNFRPESQSLESHSVFVHHCVSSSDLNYSLERLWNLEEVPSVSCLTKDEEECELHFQLTHTTTVEGHYIVRYPFKSGLPINIGASRKIAEKALSALSKKLNGSPELFVQRKKFMDVSRPATYIINIIII